MNRLAITRLSIQKYSKKEFLAYIMLDEKRNVQDFELFEDEHTLLNGIYIGRVENIIQNINAAFIRIGKEQMCYLSMEDLAAPIFTKKQSKNKPISIGDEIVVQVTKDAVKTKDPVVSSKLTIPGRYCVLTTENTSLGISKKINGPLHDELLSLFEDYKQIKEQYQFGLIIRTNAAQVTKEELQLDIDATIQKFIELKEFAVHQTAFSCLYEADSAFVQKLKTLDMSQLDGIFTDDSYIYENIKCKLPYLLEKGFLNLYNDDKVSLSTLYNISGFLDKILEKRVWLKSGANIIIEQLETLTFIDVNTSKNLSKDKKTILAVNKEAAVEIAAQLKLRNISGMIIVDFINMESEEEEQELLQVLRFAVRKDSVKTQVIDITKLGLVELTRKKVSKSLIEILQ